MRKYSWILSGCVSLILTGCAVWPGQDIKTNSLDYKMEKFAAAKDNNPVIINDDLPVEKLVIMAGGKNRQELEVEVATTEAQRRVGLMNRDSLPERKGMFFIFEKQGYLNFWMKNTLIPLDMIFIDKEGYVVHVVNDAKPCGEVQDSDCPKYNSNQPAKYVLEVNGGMAKKMGVVVGDKVTWL